MITILNAPQSDHISAAVRAKNASVRDREFFAVGLSSVKGEVTHIEAFGSIYINIAHRFNAIQCSSLPEHEHCTREMAGHDHANLGPADTVGQSEDGAACCLIPEPFPVSVYYDVPVGYGLALPLGDNLVVSLNRADDNYRVA